MSKLLRCFLGSIFIIFILIQSVAIASNIGENIVIVSSQNVEDVQEDTVKTYMIDEVTVTATRTSKKIIDIPFPVDRIDESHYRFDRKISVDDVLEAVPGLFLQNRYGNHDVRISIRGFGSRSNSGIRGVRILLDGIPESEPDGQTRIEAIDFNSIGSIEVARGNLSSLYTNAPGGVINFRSDINFQNTFAIAFNEFGSYGLRRNGLKTGIKTENYGFLTTYSYHNAKGYRDHSNDYWHILNTVLAIKPTDFSKFNIYGYFVDGMIKLPGSLTKQQFENDPYQPNSRDVSRDAKRITKKGRIGLQFNTFLDEDRDNEIELVGYGTIKYFERTAKDYRIMNRNGLGASARYVNHSELFGFENEFSIGGDLFHQSGPIETYNNLNGRRGDGVQKLTDETIANTGFYFQNSLNILKEKMDFLFTGRYDKVIFDAKDRGLDVRSAARRFEAFTPKAGLNYKLTPTIALYTSYGLSFDSPAGNELDNFPTNSDYPKLLNPDLKPQKSNNLEFGIKGNLIYPGVEFLETVFFKNIYFEATVFNSIIHDEIVPFDVTGFGVFYRNAGKTNRTGLELGTNIEIIKNLNLKSAYTYSDFKYDEYVARTIDDTGKIADADFAGMFVPSVPKHNFAITLSYDYNLTDYINGFIKGNYTNVSSMFVDDKNTEKTDAYQLFNSALGFDVAIGNFNILISGGVNNIFNKKYVAFININSDRKEYYEAGEPRNYFGGINIGYNF